jgi:ABC-type nitrate/sulfonate/bicarbonate transport system permease component
MMGRVHTILITIGILAWVPYAILAYGMGQQVSRVPFLVVHLCGVVPALILRIIGYVRARARKDAAGRGELPGS